MLALYTNGTSNLFSVFYMHADRLGTPQYVTDSTKAVVWKDLYQPFGADSPTFIGNVFLQNLRFPGQQYDAETGLYHNGQREYDTTKGRYIQTDPIGLSGGINTYAYAGSNPFRFTDESGTQAVIPTPFGPLPVPVPIVPHYTPAPSPTRRYQPSTSGPSDTSASPTGTQAPANDNESPETSTILGGQQCPFARELPSSMCTEGNRGCIYQCQTEQRFKEFSSLFSCPATIFPWEGQPYTPLQPIK
jgi:RHS repeat-associated protein